jgi:hypothetical protein
MDALGSLGLAAEESRWPLVIPFVAAPFTPKKATLEPPPAAMAAALKMAAVLRLSRRTWRRSIMASRRPLMWYGLASCRREQSICGVHNGEFCAGRDDV